MEIRDVNRTDGALDEPPVDGARHPPSLRLCA